MRVINSDANTFFEFDIKDTDQQTNLLYIRKDLITEKFFLSRLHKSDDRSDDICNITDKEIRVKPDLFRRILNFARRNNSLTTPYSRKHKNRLDPNPE